jgi:hypothetical protein
MSKGGFVALSCFFLLFLSSVKDESLATCSSPVKIAGYAYTTTSIQDAYNYASNDLSLPSFTLQLAGEIFEFEVYNDLT